MATTYRLVLVEPLLAASTANGSTVEWVLDHDEAVVTLGDESQEINTDNDINGETPAERARRLLEELEKEGSDLEESFKDDSYLQQLAMFPDMAKPEQFDETALPMDLEDTEALLLDLATILPQEASPPHSPSPIFELDELLKLRAQEVLPDPEDDLLMDMLPPTPSDSGASSSPSYAPSTPASIYSDSSNDPEWSPEPLPGPSKARRKPYTRAKHPTNRAERKKVQNKNAATRYRCKKKVEEDELLEFEADLANKNRELKEKVAEAEVEMRIVKDLLRKKFKRMGLLK